MSTVFLRFQAACGRDLADHRRSPAVFRQHREQRPNMSIEPKPPCSNRAARPVRGSRILVGRTFASVAAAFHGRAPGGRAVSAAARIATSAITDERAPPAVFALSSTFPSPFPESTF